MSFRKVFIPLLGLVGVLFLLWIIGSFLPLLIEPTSLPQNALISNVTDSQTTISWTTKIATRGRVVVSASDKFPFLSAVSGKHYIDDGDRNLGRQNFYTTHHVTVEGLSQNKTYRMRIYQGLRKVYAGNFVTGPILAAPTSPSPVYGRVVDEDKKPVVGAVIYFRAANNDEKSAPLSTLTNPEGRWTIELANLRTSDLSGSYKLAARTAEEVVVEAGARGRVRATTVVGQDKPWPDIILK